MATEVALIFEGLAPIVAPASWRDAVRRLVLLRDGQLRVAGLTAIVAGVSLQLLAR